MKAVKSSVEENFSTYLRVLRSIDSFAQLEMGWKMLGVFVKRYPENFLEISMLNNLLNLKHIKYMPDERIAA